MAVSRLHAVSVTCSWLTEKPSRNTPFTYFPDTVEGDARFEFFRQVVSFHPITHTLNAQQWDLSGSYGSSFALALCTFLYVDIIDCTATLYSMARFCGRAQQQKDRSKKRKDNSDGDFPRSTVAYCIDAACISIGSLLGCSPVTAFIESGAGIAEGGRTGLTAMVTGLCFLVSVFFAPIFASIPPWATGCTLILVSSLGLLLLILARKFNIGAGWLFDDTPSDSCELELHRRCHPFLYHHSFYPVQLQRSLWSHSVSL